MQDMVLVMVNLTFCVLVVSLVFAQEDVLLAFRQGLFGMMLHSLGGLKQHLTSFPSENQTGVSLVKSTFLFAIQESIKKRMLYTKDTFTN